MKNRYNNQLSTIGELLDADFLVLQSKLNLVNTKADAELAYYKLLKAVGK
jgi:outer membrane protein TolC